MVMAALRTVMLKHQKGKKKAKEQAAAEASEEQAAACRCGPQPVSLCQCQKVL